jgi:hypothetical protein
MGLKMPCIWDKWIKHYEKIEIKAGRICRDGIINPDKFLKAKRKILFIMKDINNRGVKDRSHGVRNLPEWLRGGPKHQLWYTIARWSVGIFNDFPAYKQIDSKMIKEAFEKIAAINLKKACGGARVDSKVINAYTHQDRELLLEQIESINPDFIISCGVTESLIWLLDLKVKNPEKPADEPIEDASRKLWVIPFRHPAMGSGKMVYNNLKKVFAKINDNL